MADRIRRHVQNRTEMLAGISHDLRTPLTRMTLELELASMDATTRSALQGDIEDMRSMIDEYLDFARGDAGELAEPIDLSVLLADLAADYQRSKRAVHFTPGGAVVVMLRPQALRRALTNVIDNALRYGGGSATLAVEQSVTVVRIKITDQGPGIAESDHETVFKPFTRLEPSRNAQTGGVGLGLSIAEYVLHDAIEGEHGHGSDLHAVNVHELLAVRCLERLHESFLSLSDGLTHSHFLKRALGAIQKTADAFNFRIKVRGAIELQAFCQNLFANFIALGSVQEHVQSLMVSGLMRLVGIRAFGQIDRVSWFYDCLVKESQS